MTQNLHKVKRLCMVKKLDTGQEKF